MQKETIETIGALEIELARLNAIEARIKTAVACLTLAFMALPLTFWLAGLL